MQSASANEVNVLVYETDETLSTTNNILSSTLPGLRAQAVGQGSTFKGFGSKYEAVLPALNRLAPDSLVVVSDGRDVLVNNAPTNSHAGIVDEFFDTFQKLTSQNPGAIVVSAEAQCCVSALTHFAPGELFGVDGKRTKRACYSGQDDCLWTGDDKAQPWESFMHDLASANGASGHEDIFLNAGLMAGRVADLISIIKEADFGELEDDQAVLTDYMYRNPGKIVLDYGQELFGNNRETCMFELDAHHLVHKQTRTSPLFIHTPGGSSTCHVQLMEELGQKSMSKSTKRRLMTWNDNKHNYYDGCPRGKKLVGDDCVAKWCFDDYQCPEGSSRIPERDCYRSNRDCECDDENLRMGATGCKRKWFLGLSS